MKLSLALLAAFFSVPTQAKWGMMFRGGGGRGGGGGAGGGGGGNGGALADLFVDPPPPLSDAEKAEIKFMYEEEKMARDVYNVLGGQWENRVFSNIAASEQKHMDNMWRLVTYFGLDLDDDVDPTNGQGDFENPRLKEFFDTQTGTGSTSRLAAFGVGALIEEVDINDLRDAIGETQVEVLKAVYNNLLNASYNHLRAFVRNYEANGGGTYVAQTAVSGLTQTEVNAILGRN